MIAREKAEWTSRQRPVQEHPILPLLPQDNPQGLRTALIFCPHNRKRLRRTRSPQPFCLCPM